MWLKLTCRKLLIQGRSIKSTSNVELLQLMDTTKRDTSTRTLLVNEFNARITTKTPEPIQPKQSIADRLRKYTLAHREEESHAKQVTN
jgi:hypothetical protein